MASTGSEHMPPPPVPPRRGRLLPSFPWGGSTADLSSQMPDAAGVSKRKDGDDDPFANFSFTPQRSSRNPRFLSSRRSKEYLKEKLELEQQRQKHREPKNIRDKYVSQMTPLGSQSSINAFGSTDHLSNTSSFMNMQEDAKSRKISAEIMKHRLYESVVTSPRRRRQSMTPGGYMTPRDYRDRMSISTDEDDVQFDDQGSLTGAWTPQRYIQSMPVSPATSTRTTPMGSPKSERRSFTGYVRNRTVSEAGTRSGFYSRGTTPDHETHAGIATEDQGLASIFRPVPRVISAHDVREPMDVDGHGDDVGIFINPAASPCSPPPGGSMFSFGMARNQRLQSDGFSIAPNPSPIRLQRPSPPRRNPPDAQYDAQHGYYGHT